MADSAVSAQEAE